MSKGSFHLIIADEPLPIDWPVKTFRDPDGFDATHADAPPTAPAALIKGEGNFPRFRKRRFAEHGERSVAAAQANIRQLVIHLDGCPDAETTFNVLHKERGLSCHFILGNDGMLYQTVDLVDCAYHAAGLNETSIGIEMCNRGDAEDDPHYYERPGMLRRDVVPCMINGHSYKAFEFTRPQYEAMVVLGKALARYLPGIRLDYPQSAPGTQQWSTLTPGGAALMQSYSGYLGHYHITERKWDPGPFDFKKHLAKITGRRSFPIGLHGKEAAVGEAPPGASPERAGYLQQFQAYYDNNELEGAGGLFPTGPLEHVELYHGGVHLRAPKGTPVMAPLPGKVLLARNGPTQLGIGSTSFVLLHHSMRVGSEPLSFYTLLFHLAQEEMAERPRWMKGKGWKAAEPNAATVLRPPELVEAGEVIGHVGVAGPDAEPQIHWEVFTLDAAAVTKLDERGFWKIYSGAADRRVCKNAEILSKLKGDDREWTHAAVTFHYSEWADRPDWTAEILGELGQRVGVRRKHQLEEMVEEQITPTLWWRDDVAGLMRLPLDARVYTYHPVSFLRWLNDLVGSRAAERPAAASAGPKAQLDIDDEAGESAITELDVNPKLQPEPPGWPQLLDGYGD